MTMYEHTDRWTDKPKTISGALKSYALIKYSTPIQIRGISELFWLYN